jgi:hypothetical protein
MLTFGFLYTARNACFDPNIYSQVVGVSSPVHFQKQVAYVLFLLRRRQDLCFGVQKSTIFKPTFISIGMARFFASAESHVFASFAINMAVLTSFDWLRAEFGVKCTQIPLLQKCVVVGFENCELGARIIQEVIIV